MYQLSLLVLYSFIAFPGNVETAKISPRIVGGRNTSIEEHPYQLLMTSNFFAYFCSAALISPTWALTTAYCGNVIYRNSKNHYYQLKMGYLLANSSYAEEGERFDIDFVVIHPNYVRDNISHDIALLKLVEPVDCVNCKPVELGDSTPQVGDVITVTGWGITDVYKWTLPHVLQSVDLPVVDRNECNSAYSDLDLEDTFCAYYKDDEAYKGACMLDEGSPTISNGKLVGLFSLAYCKEPGLAGIYTDVTRFLDWIEENVANDTFINRSD